MAVGIEPEAMLEACLSREVLFRHALNVADKPAVRFIQLAQDLGERKAPFLFYHLRIESVDAAVLQGHETGSRKRFIPADSIPWMKRFLPVICMF